MVLKKHNRSMETLIMNMCFAEGVHVVMGDLSYKNIESVQIGATVLTYNFINQGV